MREMEQSIMSSFYSELKIPDQRQADVFKEYLKMLHYAMNAPVMENVLELGSGFSTVLLAHLARCRGCKITSIDVYPSSLLDKIAGTSFQEVVSEYVRFLTGSTISKKEFDCFYNGAPKKEIAGVPANEVRANVKGFIKTGFGKRKWERLRNALGADEPCKIEALFFDDEGVVFREEVMEIFRVPGDEFEFFQKQEGEGLLGRTVSEMGPFDLVFLDSGEFSSVPEWLVLRDRIRKGGIAVFHDIYFPKSFKNFLLCAAIMSDPMYEVVYQDQSTPQGLLIAARR